MIVRYLGRNNSACDLYRGAFPFRYTESDTEFIADGVTVSIEESTDTGVTTNIEADVLIIPRPTSRIQYLTAEAAIKDGIAVVVEIDDMLDDVHMANVAYEHTTKGLEWYYKTMDIAHVITCSTPALANRYHPDKSVVLQNYIPDFILDYPIGDEKSGIGWTGSLDVHPDDLQVVGDAIRRMRKKHGWEFKHIGRGSLSDIIKCNYTAYGKLGFDQYMLGIDTFAVGIVPLARSQFNNAKSWLKGIEYAALGVPFVASSTAAEYEALNRQYGLGVLASTPYEWYTELRRLCTDDKYRAEQSLTHRDTVESELRMSKHAWRWDEAWALAHERMHSGPL